MDTSGKPAKTIRQFCDDYGISRTHYYVLGKVGRGPKEMILGRTKRISEEAETEWRARMESEPAKVGPKPARPTKRATTKQVAA